MPEDDLGEGPGGVPRLETHTRSKSDRSDLEVEWDPTPTYIFTHPYPLVVSPVLGGPRVPSGLFLRGRGPSRHRSSLPPVPRPWWFVVQTDSNQNHTRLRNP